MASAEKSKKKRKAWELKDKIAALNMLKDGKSQAQVVRSMGVGESTLRGWIDNEEKLRDMPTMMDSDEAMGRKRVKFAADKPLDRAVFTWFSQERAQGKPISGETLKAGALRLKKKLDGERGDTVNPFMASKGWLGRFKKTSWHKGSEHFRRNQVSRQTGSSCIYPPTEEDHQ